MLSLGTSQRLKSHIADLRLSWTCSALIGFPNESIKAALCWRCRVTPENSNICFVTLEHNERSTSTVAINVMVIRLSREGKSSSSMNPRYYLELGQAFTLAGKGLWSTAMCLIAWWHETKAQHQMTRKTKPSANQGSQCVFTNWRLLHCDYCWSVAEREETKPASIWLP